jgi:protein-export membrane protein SecD
MEALKRSIERRVAAAGLGEPIIQVLGENRLLIQMPGVEDPERAKSIIGETAQLVFKHRRLGVPREMDEFGSEEIVSLTAGPFPTPDELAGVEADSPSEDEVATTTDTSIATNTATTTAAAGAEEGSEAQVEDQGPAVLIVEFTEEGASAFALAMERLNESLTGSQGVSTQVGLARPNPPSTLEVSVEGTQTFRYPLLSIQIARIATTTRFALPFAPGIGEDGQVDVPTAREMLGESPSIHFTEIQGFADEDIGLTGDDLSTAYAGTHSASGQPIVTLIFKDHGARLFGELTEEIAGSAEDEIAIFLDDEQLVSPRVTTAITAGSAIIQGQDFTIERVRDLALLLESGRLPLPIELLRERNVDAILGADSLKKSLIAGAVGLSLVVIFMLLYYRLPGAIAATALVIYAGLVLATLKVLPGSFTTLNLSGVAALILSIGMAVDANILIFERMKEELRAGRTLLSAVNIGFNRAWPAIRDGNVSTLITCGVLFWFSEQLGETVLKGFAVTLAIGVGWSMFSAITVSRTLLRVVATGGISRKLGLFLPMGGAPVSEDGQAGTLTNRRS